MYISRKNQGQGIRSFSQTRVLRYIRKNLYTGEWLYASVEFDGFPCNYTVFTCTRSGGFSDVATFWVDKNTMDMSKGNNCSWPLVKRGYEMIGKKEILVNEAAWKMFPELRLFTLPFEDVGDMDHMLVQRMQEVLFEDIIEGHVGSGRLNDDFKKDADVRFHKENKVIELRNGI